MANKNNLILKNVKLESKNLILRNYKKRDLQDIVNCYNDKVFSKNIPTMPYPYKFKDAEKFLEITKNSLKKEKPSLQLAVYLKKEKKVIGGVSLAHIDFENRNAESGSSISKDYWGTKLIYEAKLELYKFAFKELKLVKIYSKVFAHNIRSKKHLEKLGFTQQGYLQKEVILRNKKIDTFYLELLKEQFKYKELKKKIF